MKDKKFWGIMRSMFGNAISGSYKGATGWTETKKPVTMKKLF